MNKNFIILIFIIIFSSLTNLSARTKVGNGDDGSDLENLTLVTNGKIIETKEETLNLLKTLNTDGIKYLGLLYKDIEATKIYMAKDELKAKLSSDLNPYHSGLEGLVYARTVAFPLSPTRFFPIALKLANSQLIALHIHEGLHRTLPKEVREDETIVSRITLAIISPGATHDAIEATVNELISIDESKGKLNPSSISLSYLRYLDPKHDPNKQRSLPIRHMYKLSSYIYPFNKQLKNLGLGLDIAILQTTNDTDLGPLGLSARYIFLSENGINFEGFVSASLNTLSRPVSSSEVENSGLGRDILTFGTTLRKETKLFYLENDLSYTLGSKKKQKIGNTEFAFNYGPIIMAAIKLGISYDQFNLGAFGEMYLSDNYKIESLDYNYESGRTRILAAGPELSYKYSNFKLGVLARFMLESTKDADFDRLGNLMGAGVGQGYFGTTLTMNF